LDSIERLSERNRTRCSRGLALVLVITQSGYVHSKSRITWARQQTRSKFLVARGAMKDPQEVLREKELDVRRVRREIAALHSVISLLAEPSDWAEYGLALPPLLSQVQEVRTASVNGTGSCSRYWQSYHVECPFYEANLNGM